MNPRGLQVFMSEISFEQNRGFNVKQGDRFYNRGLHNKRVCPSFVMIVEPFFDIESAVTTSAKTGQVLAITLRNKPVKIITAVEKYLNKGDLKLITLRNPDLYGHELVETVLHLSDISKAMPLMAWYYDPVYVNLRKVKGTLLKNTGSPQAEPEDLE